MRFFIFPLDNIHIAVAADKVKCFISLDNVQEDSYQAEPGQIKIPIYIVFGKSRGENISCHGIVLKQKTSRDETLVIITPHIEKDINIDEKEIQSLPGCFSDVYSSFSGLYFNGQKIVLFLNVDNMISLWLKNPERVQLPAEGQAQG